LTFKNALYLSFIPELIFENLAFKIDLGLHQFLYFCLCMYQ